MQKPSARTPSDLVFSAAIEIANDMKLMVDDAVGELDDYANIMTNIRKALSNTKDNLERHAIPMSGKKSRQRRTLRAKIRSISEAMAVAKKIESTIMLTMDDIHQIMKPFEADVRTQKFLDGIMAEEPTDGELRDLEDEGPTV